MRSGLLSVSRRAAVEIEPIANRLVAAGGDLASRVSPPVNMCLDSATDFDLAAVVAAVAAVARVS